MKIINSRKANRTFVALSRNSNRAFIASAASIFFTLVAIVLCPAISAHTAENDRVGKFEYSIRPLQDSDIPRISEISAGLFPEENDLVNQVIDYNLGPSFMNREAHAHHPFVGFGYGIEVDGVLVGHITAGFITQEILTQFQINHWVSGCYITEVGVLPDYQRAGLAKRLIEEVLTRAGDRPSSLHVKADNVGAIALYNKLNFQPLANEKDAIYMVRRK